MVLFEGPNGLRSQEDDMVPAAVGESTCPFRTEQWKYVVPAPVKKQKLPQAGVVAGIGDLKGL